MSADIVALIERLGRLLATDSHAESLLPVHWEALRYLHKANRFSRTHAALTSYLGLTKGTVSQTISVLEAKALISREVDESDRRSKRLKLTPRGRNLLKRDPVEDWRAQVDQLTSADQSGLARGLAELLDQRLAAQNRTPFGQCHSCLYFVDEHEDGNPHYCDLLKASLSDDDSERICVEQRVA